MPDSGQVPTRSPTRPAREVRACRVRHAVLDDETVVLEHDKLLVLPQREGKNFWPLIPARGMAFRNLHYGHYTTGRAGHDYYRASNVIQRVRKRIRVETKINSLFLFFPLFFVSDLLNSQKSRQDHSGSHTAGSCVNQAVETFRCSLANFSKVLTSSSSR